jgi:hypothetical protein
MHMPLREEDGLSLPREPARGEVTAATSTLIVAVGVAISCIVHLAFLTPALVFGGHPFDTPPVQAIMVDLVSPEEVPKEVPKPPEKPADESAEKPAPSAGETAAKETAPPPALASPAPPATSQAFQSPALLPALLPAPAFTTQQPEAARPPEPDDAKAAGPFGMPLTMPDGTVGGRPFDQAAVERADVKDAADEFRSHLKTCAQPPANVAPGVRVVVRIHLNPDGTLVAGLPSNPEPLKVSMGGGELFQSAVAALIKCQPYTMLPPDRYADWRMLDLTFTPQNF